jgi:5-(carboxyamino)imidazole ribonucleotide mutase
MSEETPLVGVLAASPAELPVMRQTGLILEKFGVPHEVRIISSSRNPDLVDEWARIGVPIASSPQLVGNEALAITAQMPTGVPIAAVGVDAAVNAAILATQILGVADEELQAKLWRFKDDLAEGLKL